VLVHGDFSCKIADFGLSRELLDSEGDYYASAMAAVPLRWTAPEALRTRHYATSSDVWSFGILCCEVFDNGARPYAALNNSEVLLRLESGRGPDRPASCPRPFYDAVVAPCLAFSPALRPGFAALLQWVQPWAEEEPAALGDARFPRRRPSIYGIPEEVLPAAFAASLGSAGQTLSSSPSLAVAVGPATNSTAGAGTGSSLGLAAEASPDVFYSPFRYAVNSAQPSPGNTLARADAPPPPAPGDMETSFV
jgi:serine/threonine protein kinase